MTFRMPEPERGQIIVDEVGGWEIDPQLALPGFPYDDDDAPDTDPGCGDIYDRAADLAPFFCTRVRNHDGWHVAGLMETPPLAVAAWPPKEG